MGMNGLLTQGSCFTVCASSHKRRLLMYFDQPFFTKKVMMNRKYIFYQDNFKSTYKMTKCSDIAAKDETKKKNQ